MNLIREAVVSGSFYTKDPKVLEKQINSFIENAEIKYSFTECLGILSPHAGYYFSGQCAGYGFKALKQRKFKRAIVIAPSHRVGDFDFSIGKYDCYRTPLGEIPVDQRAISKIEDIEKISFIRQAHENEHSLEVQLPFLQVINKNFSLIPIIMGRQNIQTATKLANLLAQSFVDSWEDTIIVASSDLSHYYNASEAESKDKNLIELLENFDIESLNKEFISREIEACGWGIILTLLILGRIIGKDHLKNLNYTHSGKINNDPSKVVGYTSSIVF